MKKLTAVALLSIAITSCKNETKTGTTTDPVTRKTVNTETTTETATTAEKTETIAAIRDSAGVFRQTFKLEKGQTYPFTTYQRNVQTFSLPDGKSESGTTESTDEMSFKVNDFKDSMYDITINLISKRNSQTAQGKTIVVDTNQAPPTQQELKMMYTVNKALTNSQLHLKLSEGGQIVSITGFDKIYSKINSAVTPMIKDAKARSAALGKMKAGFSEKILKEQLGKNLLILPKKGVKLGEKWTVSENASQDGKTKISTIYTLKSVENGKATVAISGGIPYKSASQNRTGMSHSMSSELSQSGNIILDANSGWIYSQNIAVKTIQKETISDGKKSQTMTTSSTSSVMVNPSNKQL